MNSKIIQTHLKKKKLSLKFVSNIKVMFLMCLYKFIRLLIMTESSNYFNEVNGSNECNLSNKKFFKIVIKKNQNLIFCQNDNYCRKEKIFSFKILRALLNVLLFFIVYI